MNEFVDYLFINHPQLIEGVQNFTVHRGSTALSGSGDSPALWLAIEYESLNEAQRENAAEIIRLAKDYGGDGGADNIEFGGDEEDGFDD